MEKAEKILEGLTDTNPPPDLLNVDDLPDWVQWLAQDADATWWAYEADHGWHGYEADHGWYENEVGRYQRLAKTESNPRWQDFYADTRI